MYKHRAIRAETEKVAYLAAVTNKLENPVEQVKNSLEGMVTSIEREEMDLQDVSMILRSQVEELSLVSANLRSLNNSIFRV